MNAAEFAAICATLPGEGGRTQQAAYRVLVDGLTLGQACREVGVDKGATSKLCARMRTLAAEGCPTCGASLIGSTP